MVIQKKACAGTLESSDIYVEVAPLPAGSGIKLDLNSVVYAQFGKESAPPPQGLWRSSGNHSHPRLRCGSDDVYTGKQRSPGRGG